MVSYLRIGVQIILYLVGFCYGDESKVDSEQIVSRIKKLKPLEELLQPAGFQITIPHINGVTDVCIKGCMQFPDNKPYKEKQFHKPMKRTNKTSWVYNDHNTLLGWGDRVPYTLIFNTSDNHVYNSSKFFLIVIKSDNKLVPLNYEGERIIRLINEETN